MLRRLGLTDLGEIPATAWPDWTSALLASGRPRLAVARLAGGTIALGRYQRGSVALTARGREARVVRRLTGGRAVALGEGIVAVALVLPHRAWLTGDDPTVVPAAKFLNRSVRGLLTGLAALGVPAHYFGRDFVTAADGQAGHLSFEFDGEGHALLECLLAVEAHWLLPADCEALPQRAPTRGVPGPAQLTALESCGNGRLLDALGAGCARWFGIETAADERPAPPVAFAEPEPELPAWSPLGEVPIGYVQAGAALAEGRFVRVALRGDFLADSPGIRGLEAALAEGPATLAHVAQIFNAAALDPNHAMLGLSDLAVWADAFRALGAT